MTAETFGYIGSMFLTINAVPELVRTIRDGRCHIGWPMLVLWFLGEIFTTTYVMMLQDIPLLINYLFNFVVVTIMLLYKIRQVYRQINFTAEFPIEPEF